MNSANHSTESPAYAAPTLTVYGSVVELTAGGSGQSCENQGPKGCIIGTPGGNPKKKG